MFPARWSIAREFSIRFTKICVFLGCCQARVVGARGLMTAKNELSRRKFLTTAAAAAATTGSAFTIVPRHVLGRGFTPPSDKLNIAGVGVGGIGRANLIALASQNIVALCDVDWDYAGKAFEHLDVD